MAEVPRPCNDSLLKSLPMAGAKFYQADHGTPQHKMIPSTDYA